MNFIYTILYILALRYVQFTSCDDTKLELFINSFNRAQPELKWIRVNFKNKLPERHRRFEKNENDLYIVEDDENGDYWYNNFRKAECIEDGHKNYCNIYEKKTINSPIPTSDTSNKFVNLQTFHNDNFGHYLDKNLENLANELIQQKHMYGNEFNKDRKYDSQSVASDEMVQNVNTLHTAKNIESPKIIIDEPEQKINSKYYNKNNFADDYGDYEKINQETFDSKTKAQKTNIENLKNNKNVLQNVNNKQFNAEINENFENHINEKTPQENVYKQLPKFNVFEKDIFPSVYKSNFPNHLNSPKSNKPLEAVLNNIDSNVETSNDHQFSEPKQVDETNLFHKFNTKLLGDNDYHYSSFYPNDNYNSNSSLNSLSKKRSSTVNSNDLNDQREQDKNDLSHEANYKLSKIEQEDIDNNRRHDLSTSLPEMNYHKRYFNYNPINEIKLKTSNRMMEKGLGASLPSDSFDENSNYKFRSHEESWPKKSINSFNFQVNEDIGYKSRKLLEFNSDSSIADENLLGRENLIKIINLSNELVENETEKHKMEKEKSSKGNKEVKEDKKHTKNITTTIREKLDPDDYDDDYDQIFEIYKNNFHDDQRENFPNEQHKLIIVEKMDKHKLDNSSSKNQPSTKENVSKLNETISNNTTNDRTNKAMSSNETNQVNKIEINLEVKTSSDQNPVEKKIIKRETDHKQKHIKNSHGSSLHDLMSGKFPHQLVTAVFELVRNNENLNKHIGPKLNTNLIEFKDETDENKNNTESIRKSEKMLKNVMTTITELIKEQVSDQSCIPLRPDLQVFYDKLKRFNAMRNYKEVEVLEIDDDQNDQKKDNVRNKRFTRNISDAEIHERYETIQKLLDKYSKLPASDQLKTYNIKSYLQDHLLLLDNIKSASKDQKRKTRNEHTHIFEPQDHRDDALLSEVYHNVITSKYDQLIKTADLFGQNSQFNMKRSDEISDYDDEYDEP